MAITAFKTYVAGEVLLASDLNSSFDEIIAQVNTNTADIATNLGNINSNDTDIATNTAAIALNTTAVAKGVNHGRNLIINGDFQEACWQRGTSDTTTTTEKYVADRWYGVNSSASTITLARQTFALGQTDVAGYPTHYHKLSWLGTGSTTTPQIGQRIEGVSRFGAEEVTLTFNAKTGTDFDVEVYVVQNFGTGGSPSTEVSTLIDTESITSTWDEFTNTFTIPSVSGKTLGTNGDDYTEIRFIRNLGTAAGDFDLANVQLEFGATATDFEYVNPADQLARCQRYYLDILAGDYVSDKPITPVAYWATTEARVPYTYPVTMRAVPTLDISDVTHFKILVAGNARSTTNFVLTSATITSPSTAEFKITTAADTAGRAGWLRTAAGAARLGMDAEL